MFLSAFVKQLPKPNFSMPSKNETMAVLAELLEAGKITPVIDRTFPLREVSEAIGYLASGRARGRVVIAP
jgi:NADPH:quinone reductase-like Zn-dependent oxidoreductase